MVQDGPNTTCITRVDMLQPWQQVSQITSWSVSDINEGQLKSLMKDVSIDFTLRGPSARRSIMWRVCYGIHLNYNCTKWPASIIMKPIKLVEQGKSMELSVHLMHLKHFFLLMSCNYIEVELADAAAFEMRVIPVERATAGSNNTYHCPCLMLQIRCLELPFLKNS